MNAVVLQDSEDERQDRFDHDEIVSNSIHLSILLFESNAMQVLLSILDKETARTSDKAP